MPNLQDSLDAIDTTLPGNSGTAAGDNPFAAEGGQVTEQYSPSALLNQVDTLSPQDFQDSIKGQNLTFNLNPDEVSKSSTNVRQNVINYAEKFLGVPYVWGGTSPQGFDCSGLIQYVTRKFGMNTPRLSYAQAGMGARTAMKDLQPGDFVAFSHAGSTAADHIAIYIGHGQIIEAPHTGATVRIRTLGANERYWGVHVKYPGER